MFSDYLLHVGAIHADGLLDAAEVDIHLIVDEPDLVMNGVYVQLGPDFYVLSVIRQRFEGVCISEVVVLQLLEPAGELSLGVIVELLDL